MKIKTSELSGTALDWAVAQVQIKAGEITPDSEEHGTGRLYFNCKHHTPSLWGAGKEQTGTINQETGAPWVMHGPGGDYSPSTKWSQGGPLIESNQVFLDPPHDMRRANYDEKTGKVKGCWETYESWHATVSARVRTLPPKIEGFPGRVGRGEGETALIAACRAIVTSVFGDEVEIPQELAP